MEDLKNIIESLKPDGILAIVDSDPEKKRHGRHHFTSEKKIVEQLGKAGFDVFRIERFLEDDNIYLCRPRR